MRNLIGACLLLVAVIGVNAAPQAAATTKPTTKPTTTTRRAITTTTKRTTTRRTTTTKPTTTTAAPTTTAPCPFKKIVASGRIVGGVAVSIADYPYQLSFRTNGYHFCGATIISPYWAVTAAHCCVYELATLTLKAGSATRSSGGTIHKVIQMTPHESYSDTTHEFDIGMLKVGTPFVYKPNLIAAIDLHTAEAVELPAGTNSTVSGWGTMVAGTSNLPKQLMAVAVPIVSQASCKNSYGAALITDNMLCAGFALGGKDSCQGDSGGPLVVSGCGRKILVGVVSWGYSCAQPNYPGVYASVSKLRSWINATSGI